MLDPTSRIRLMERSLRCFVLGLCSLIPVIGSVPALMAIGNYFKVRSESGKEWNPARPYLVAGVCLALLGLLESIAVLGFIAVLLVTQSGLLP
jgi:hypothetical protein